MNKTIITNIFQILQQNKKVIEISQIDFGDFKIFREKKSALKTIRIGDIFLISDQRLTIKPHLSDSLNLMTSVRAELIKKLPLVHRCLHYYMC